MKKHLLSWVGGTFFIGAIATLSILSSCKKDNNNVTSPPAPPNSIRVVNNAKYGKILTDSAGRTLYFFSNDPNGTSTCTAGCLVAWPVFYKAAPTMDTGLTKTDFSSFTRTDGAQQLTYKGWPLYYYQTDSAVGDVKGEGIGNVWFVAKPDYSVMYAKTQLVGNDGANYDSTYKAGTGKTLYLTDDYGRTLYAFSPDKSRKNNYTKSDFSNDATWPIYQVSPQGIPSSINRTLFDTIHVFGKVQMTFKGWPLYYFGPDNKVRGSTKGVSVPTPGVWPVINQYSAAAPL
jgi:predicted lipoprotein with Yx(FWY)xxD motif